MRLWSISDDGSSSALWAVVSRFWVCCALGWWLPAIGGTTAAGAQSLEVIPPSGEWVTDQAGLLTPTEEEALSRKLAAYADTTSTQIVIVTIPDLGGVEASDYAIELGRRWGVGRSDVDNGAVILVARDDREVFIATGYGLEGSIPDATASRIVRNILVPSFRNGRFYEGLSQGADALLYAARGEYAPRPGPVSSVDDVTLVFVILLVLVLVVLVISAHRQRGGGHPTRPRRRHRRTGPPVIIWGGGGPRSRSGGWGGGGWSGGLGGGGFGGFSGGGGSFGGGGAGGSW